MLPHSFALATASLALAAAYRSEVIRKPISPVITQPLPHTFVDLEAVPKAFDWRNISGVSLVTQNLNQHIPQCAYRGRGGTSHRTARARARSLFLTHTTRAGPRTRLCALVLRHL